MGFRKPNIKAKAFMLGLAVCFLAAAGLPGWVRAWDGAGTVNPGDAAAFVDAFFAERLASSRTPGAICILVKGGQVLLARGYGYADLEARRPMDPDRTVLRVASLSKPVVAVAVLQLAERGRLDLYADVNLYLRQLKVPPVYPRPVTLASLLTHTSGLDEGLIGMAARDGAGLVPLGDYLKSRLPARVRPPGEVIRYSNDGVALAALIVEEVSGRPFAEYAAANIFWPLGMARSSFGPRPDLMPELAAGYEARAGTLQRAPFDYFNVGPAASLLTTGSDLGRLLIGLFEGGRGEARILTEESVRQMFTRQFTHHPRLPGVTFGFFEYFANGRRALIHEGDWRGFAGLVLLIPEERLGLFVANNGQNHRLNLELVNQFLDRYYPAANSPAPAAVPAAGDLGRFAGSYRTVRYGQRSVEKLATLVEQFRVVADRGRLFLYGFGPGPAEFVLVDRMLFKMASGENYIAFREDETGRITHLFLGGDRFYPTALALEKVPWFETSEFGQLLVAAFGVLFGSACLAWPVGRWLGRRSGAFSLLAGKAGLGASLLGGINLSLLGGVTVGLFAIDRYEFVYGIPPGLLAVLKLSVFSALLGPLVGAVCLLAWVRGWGSTPSRLYYTAVAVGGLGFIWFLATWNLLPPP